MPAKAGTQVRIGSRFHARAPTHVIARLVAIKPSQTGKRIGGAKGRFVVPDTFDADEPAITALFTGNAG
jgi:antitoxin (DNA-binding transcriptional repressor) of toxin-antitoxin stability system